VYTPVVIQSFATNPLAADAQNSIRPFLMLNWSTFIFLHQLLPPEMFLDITLYIEASAVVHIVRFRSPVCCTSNPTVKGGWENQVAELLLVTSLFQNSPDGTLKRAAVEALVSDLDWLKAGRQVV